MKNLKNLGKALSKAEQQSINGGLVTPPSLICNDKEYSECELPFRWYNGACCQV